MYGPTTRNTVASMSFVLAPLAGLVNGTPDPLPLAANVWTVYAPYAPVKRYKVSGRFAPFADDDMVAESGAPRVAAVAPEVSAFSASTLHGNTPHLFPTMYDETERIKFIFRNVDNVTVTDATAPFRLHLPDYDINQMKDFEFDEMYFGCGSNSEHSRDLYSPSTSSNASGHWSSADTSLGYDSDSPNTSICTEDDLGVIGSPFRVKTPYRGRANPPLPLMLLEGIHMRTFEDVIVEEGPSPPASPTLPPIASPAPAPDPRVDLDNQTALDVLEDTQYGGEYGGGLLFSHVKLLDAKVPQDDLEQRTRDAIAKAQFGEEVMKALKPHLAVGVQMVMDLLDEVDSELDGFE
ncbi:hypothetical protein EST38_g160 [Candolleomyces aberdarensis]|uniref:Uncharacterized protein n=1 Tax=Candolleomyces aberdarensis TaxID=2316362 RepID=A0A4Q2E1R7_9AGAR|nr:hypothetical protein EST38_g160 [Candolleomyces aberdarensis]